MRHMLDLFILTASLTKFALSLPGYRNVIPNGKNIRCFSEAVGCNDVGICEGVGHATCAGGSLPLNPFGLDLAAAGHRWTRELCEKDSDNDGLTNGVELGDPCCEFVVGAIPRMNQQDFNFFASHPGNAYSRHNTSMAIECEDSSAEVETGPSITHDNFYLPVETQFSQIMMIENTTLPNKTTEYINFAFEIDFGDHETLHLVGAEAIISNVKKVHHLFLYGLNEERAPLRNGQEYNRDNMISDAPVIWGWAPGITHYIANKRSAMRFERNGTNSYLMLSVHYDNPLRESGDWDKSGLRLHFTPDLREEDTIATEYSSYGSGVDIGLIPAGQPSFFKSHISKVHIEDQGNVTLVAYNGHAHLAGRAVFTEQYRGCEKVRDVMRDMSYSFDEQKFDYFNPGIVIKDGDIIQNTCVYDTTERNESTSGGFGSMDEMCLVLLYVYPAVEIEFETIDFYDGVVTNEDYNIPFAVNHPAPVSGSSPGCGNGTMEEKVANLGPVVFSVLSGQCEAHLSVDQMDELKGKLLDPTTDSTYENLPNLIVEMVLTMCGLSNIGNQCPPKCLDILEGLITCIPPSFSEFTSAFPAICENFEGTAF